MIIRPGDFSDGRVLDLLRLHLSHMRAHSPACAVHALDLSGLRQPSISFFTAWKGETLLGCGALKALAAAAGELKSMRTDPQHLRKGVGQGLLDHLIGLARQRNYRTLSLETGSGEAFEPALALYRKNGFANGAAFADYEASDFDQFLHLEL